MPPTKTNIAPDDAASPTEAEAAPDIRAWQEKRIEERLRSADAGRFASAEAVRTIIQKYVRNG